MSYKHNKKIDIHPGEVLQEILKEQGITQLQLAKTISISQPYISDIINGRRDMTATLAYKLAAALDIPAESWMNLQKNWELAKVSPTVAKGIKKIAA